MQSVVSLFACQMKDARITALDSSGSEVFIGTSQGVLQRWSVQQEGEDQEYVSRQLCQLQLKRKPVVQLICDPVWPILFALCDEQVSAYSVDTFAKEFPVLDDSKKSVLTGCICISVAPVYKGTHRICVATKKKLYLYMYKAVLPDEKGVRVGTPSCELFQKLMLPSAVLSLAFYGETLCCGFLKEYSLLDCYSGKVTGLFPLSTQQPYVKLLDSEQAALCSVGVKTIKVSVKPSDLKASASAAGRLTRDMVRWSSEPKAIAFKHPFIIGLLANRTEVYSMYEGSIVQVMQNVQGASLTCTRTPTKNDHVCFATDKEVFMLMPIKVEDQVHALIGKLKMTEAFDLLYRNATGDEAADEEKKNQCHIEAGFAFLFRGRPESAFEHFAATTVNLKDLLVHFPRLLPPALRQSAIDEYEVRYGAMPATASLNADGTFITLSDRYVTRCGAEAASLSGSGGLANANTNASTWSYSSNNGSTCDDAALSPAGSPTTLSAAGQSGGGSAFDDAPGDCSSQHTSAAASRCGTPMHSPSPVASDVRSSFAGGAGGASAAAGSGGGSNVGAMMAANNSMVRHSAASLLSHATDSLLLFLTVRRDTSKGEQRRCIDYVLLYVNVDRNHCEAVHQLLTMPDNSCDLSDCLPVLENHRPYPLHTATALLLLSKQRHAEAAKYFDKADNVRKILLRGRVRVGGGGGAEGGCMRDIEVVDRTGDDLDGLRRDSHAIFMAVGMQKPEFVKRLLVASEAQRRRLAAEAGGGDGEEAGEAGATPSVDTWDVIRQVDAAGNTALHHAVATICVHNDESQAAVAAASSAKSPSAGDARRPTALSPTNNGRSPKSFGTFEQEAILGMLVSHGADVHAKNRYGLSPMDVAHGASLKVWGMLLAMSELRDLCAATAKYA
eukprot:Rhum_TRINITY_DN3357_c0_g1::Rhum_TRINITY_DN3357_c0_g1_i1::g.10413::m.10413/K20183/VPS39, VAM6; Vam6/Vps39-like protein vacuolar protein sorting-associated protein 39